MTSSITPAQASQPAQGGADDEIDLRQLAAALQRRWRLIAKVAGGTLLLSAAYAFLSKPVWEGEFQIVLASEQGGGGRLAQLAAANPMLAGLAGLGGAGGKDSLETEVKVLESPSVLKPVYDFVRSSKQRGGENVDDLRFSDWFKDNLTVKLEKGTSVLNIAYTDTDRSLVLPVIERISRAYQTYSGRDRRRDIANAVTYLRQSIDALAPKAEASMQRAQAYALSHGLGLNDGMPAAAADKGGGGVAVVVLLKPTASWPRLGCCCWSNSWPRPAPAAATCSSRPPSSRPTTSSTSNTSPPRPASATSAAACATTTNWCATCSVSA